MTRPPQSLPRGSANIAYYVNEARRSLQRGHQDADKSRYVVGETLTLDGGATMVWDRFSGESMRIVDSSGNVVQQIQFRNGAFWSHDSAGQYWIVSEDGKNMGSYTVHESYEYGGAEDMSREDSFNVHSDDTLDPSNYRGIVNADNDEGIALAPALRRQGASLGPDGGTVTLPDGETVGVGAIEESDEVARYLEGDDAGDVVEADRPAVDGGSSSGGSGGMIGGAVAVVVLLVAGAAALLGGGD